MSLGQHGQTVCSVAEAITSQIEVQKVQSQQASLPAMSIQKDE